MLRGIAWLGERYRVHFDWSIFERLGFLAGSDARRLDELNAALVEPGVRAIVAARGGYGLTRIAAAVEWPALVQNPRWLVGFSDSTVLHVEAARVGVASFHADNVGGLGRAWQPARERWRAALEAPDAPRTFRNLPSLWPGCARGPLFGGNLAMLYACAAAGRLYVPDGAILALEDVNEAAYRVDRMLSALLGSGALDRVSGVLLGDFLDCLPGPYGVSTERVLQERLSTLRVPVLARVPFGHDRVNVPLPLGLEAHVDADGGCLTICP